MAVLVGGHDTGYEQCSGGSLRRRAVVTCPSLLPRSANGACALEASVPDAGGFCRSDQDCKDRPYGHCEDQSGSGGPSECACEYGCERDGDCTAGQICVCADPVGHCESASCTSGAGCGGCDCIDSADNPGCPGKSFSCQTPADECTSDTDCPAGTMCSREPAGRHICAAGTCVVGRPFLVQGAERLAAATARGDWLEAHVRPEVRGLGAEVRSGLAAHWTRIGLMEHASIAAFARFALQLLALGAPPELVQQAQRAMVDEMNHARLAFALASAYGRSEIGPGPLRIDGSLDELDARHFAATLVREGCVGETVAAVEALEELACTTDVTVRHVLGIIARDEQRHAELAWRALAWLLGAGKVTADQVREELAAASLEPEAPSMLRVETLTRVVGPLAHAVVGLARARHEWRRSAGHDRVT